MEAQQVPHELPDLPEDAVAISFERVPHLNGPFGGPPGPARLVIRDEGAWMEFLTGLAGPMLEELPEVRDVNFTRNIILVAALGQRPTAGYGVSIEAVYESGGRLFVDVLETTPEPGSVLAQVMSAPVAAVLVAVHVGPVTFMERSEVGRRR